MFKSLIRLQRRKQEIKHLFIFKSLRRLQRFVVLLKKSTILGALTLKMSFHGFCSSYSNLDCFLESTTPHVRSLVLPKNSKRGMVDEPTEYFALSDLWQSFDEWSAYGVGVSVAVKDQTVVQYYVPHLSALHIYVTKNYKEDSSEINEKEDSNEDSSEINQKEDISNMNQKEGGDTSDSSLWSNCSDAASEDSSLDHDSTCRNKLDLTSEDSSLDHDSNSNIQNKLTIRPIKYTESANPSHRVPLMDKIIELSGKYPEIMSLRSIDYCPASWMSIYWNPIYHIPSVRTTKDLSTCFLTYHTLSPLFQENENNNAGNEGDLQIKQKDDYDLALPPFGLSTYKMNGTVWSPQSNTSPQKIRNLYSAAESWLKQHDFYHSDFCFFAQNRV